MSTCPAPVQPERISAGSPASAGSVRRAVAQCILGEMQGELRLGTVTLYPHQASAVRRVQRTLHDYGGALLFDAVGLGKTYTALAASAAYDSPLIVAPAVLRTMWQSALASTGIDAEFISFEALSRGATVVRRHTFIIADEAHYLRNPCTRRYAEVARLCMRAPILLLSATPIHNSRGDLSALAALFMGHKASTLGDSALSHIVIRRAELPRSSGTRMPRVEHAPALVIASDDGILDRILALPPSLPPRDGGSAATLTTQGLVRQWVSSGAALRGALKRRIARAHALTAALDAGRYPTRAELQGWVFADDALQLAFPELLASADWIEPELRCTVVAHAEALQQLAREIATPGSVDAARVGFVRDVLNAHPDEKVVAFTSYKETASALYRALRGLGGVALMTSSGGTVAGGALTRAETLERFAPKACSAREPAMRDAIRLLVTTDLLSEGVNLQDASVVIHLDLPWTAARLEQRIGRVARLGSQHPVVTSYILRPSERAELFLKAVETVERKTRLARGVLGSPGGVADSDKPSRASCVELAESVRSELERWLRGVVVGDPPIIGETVSHTVVAQPLVAAVSSEATGAIVACIVDGRPELLLVNELVSGVLRVSTEAASVSAAMAQATGPERTGPQALTSQTENAVKQWYQERRAAMDAGVGANYSRNDITVSGADRHVRVAIRKADAAGVSHRFAARGEWTKRASLLRTAAMSPMPIALERWLYDESNDECDCGGDIGTSAAVLHRDAQIEAELGLTLVAILLFDGRGS